MARVVLKCEAMRGDARLRDAPRIGRLQTRTRGGRVNPGLDSGLNSAAASQNRGESNRSCPRLTWPRETSAPAQAQRYGRSPVAAPTHSRPFGVRCPITATRVVDTGDHKPFALGVDACRTRTDGCRSLWRCWPRAERFDHFADNPRSRASRPSISDAENIAAGANAKRRAIRLAGTLATAALYSMTLSL